MKQGVVETIKTMVVALLLVAVIRSLLFQPFWIPSGSMVPSLLVGDYLFVNKFAYGVSRYSFPFAPDWFAGRIRVPLLSHAPRRGDVVVFVPPNETDEIFVKRLVGLPGDTLQVTGGQLYINGIVAPRVEQGTYVDDSSGGPVMTEEFTETLPGGKTHKILKLTDQGFANNTPVYTVPAGDYFLMGDNRDNSWDSRFLDGPVGYVPAANLLGPAEIILGSADMHAPLWQVWKWPGELRWGRFFHPVH
jgi:signal peptidase I